MEDFDKVLWGFGFSIIGILFGWALNLISQWFNVRQDDKKNLKLVLFNLLETYFIFIRSDFDKYIEKITIKVQNKIPSQHQNKETKEFIQNLYLGIVNNHLKPELIEDLKLIQTNYQSSIKTLASIDPLTAYYLSGRINITQSFDNIQMMFEEIKNQFPAEVNKIQSETNKAIALLKPDLFKKSLIDLEKDIKKIAFKINPVVWFKSINAINRAKTNSNKKLDKEIDKMFDKLNPLFDDLNK